MRKHNLSLLILPLLLTSCANAGVSFEKMKEHIDAIPANELYPYYKVAGAIDLHNELIEVEEEFTKEPSDSTYVANARFNDGFAVPSDRNGANTLIYTMASHSYWLRAPMKIDSSNFYALNDNGGENTSSAHYILKKIITYFAVTQSGNFNPPGCEMKYEIHEDGSFAFYGNEVRTQFSVDNYPYYYDPAKHPELDVWEAGDPTPLYSTNSTFLDGRWNIRFEYDKDGWLLKEYAETVGYNKADAKYDQVAISAIYSYKFHD